MSRIGPWSEMTTGTVIWNKWKVDGKYTGTETGSSTQTWTVTEPTTRHFPEKWDYDRHWTYTDVTQTSTVSRSLRGGV